MKWTPEVDRATAAAVRAAEIAQSVCESLAEKRRKAELTMLSLAKRTLVVPWVKGTGTQEGGDDE